MMKLAGSIDGFTMKKDGSASLRIGTQELSNADVLEIHSHLRLFGWFVFSEQDNIEAPKEKVPDREKSPSKRLRSSLYVLHKQRGGDNANFEQFYLKQMEKVILKIQDLLE